MRGQFVIFPDSPRQQIIPNRIVDQGEQAFLKMLFQGDESYVAGGANFYVGLYNHAPAEADILATITNEPTNAGGYARKALERNTTGFPTVSQFNGLYLVRSKLITWAPVGADYSVSINRMFLTNILTGTGGTLFAFSGPLPTPILIEDGASFPARYEFFLD